LHWTIKNIVQWSGIGVLLIGLVVIYRTFDPATTGFFPACPFRSLTGLLCPGCGSQRALHHLLHLEIFPAWNQNPLLVASIPYVMLGFGFDHVFKPSAEMLKWRKILFGRRAIFIVLSVVLFFWVLRNIF
jgi:hypothetical protein